LGRGGILPQMPVLAKSLGFLTQAIEIALAAKGS
jgi:hypothetical protein